MSTLMVVPTYWARVEAQGWRRGDDVYDHPTALDKEGELRRLIESIAVLEDKGFRVAVISVPATDEIQWEVEMKVDAILRSARDVGVEILHFGTSRLHRLREFLERENRQDLLPFARVRGYPHVRNMGLILGQVLDAEIVVFIDDDEVFHDPAYMRKAREFIGKPYEGQRVWAVAGYYLNPAGEYHIRKPFHPYMRHWDQVRRMNEAFDRIIAPPPRLKVTPFVFGGNMILHRELYTQFPFDTGITRGEDIDYLLTVKMFGHDFYLDRELAIKHLPPPKTHPLWRQIREDIYRFFWEREKLRGQQAVAVPRPISPEDLDPYPGAFLRDDLEEKVDHASRLLALEYLAEGDLEGARGALENIVIAETEARPRENPLERFLGLKERWEQLMAFLETHRKALEDRIFGRPPFV